MQDTTKGLVEKGLPWKKDVRWPVVAVEAAVLIGVGLFILFDKDRASDVILQLVGVVLLATSVLIAVGNFRNAEAGLGFFDAFRAGIGVTVGTIATAAWWSDYIDDHAIRIILGWGLIAYSLLHVIGVVMVRGRAGLRLSVLATLALSVVLGIVLLTGDEASSGSRLTLLGTILLVFGILLAALAYYVYKNQSKPSEAVPAAAS